MTPNSQTINYAELLEFAIRSLAEKARARFPQYTLYSGSQQNRKTFQTYAGYPESQQARIYNDFLKYASIMESIISSETPLSNKSSLWVALKMFGHQMGNDDLFSCIEDSDVIEVYRSDGIQVFRNLNFLDICSYELPELFVYPWHELFYRHPKHVKMIADGAVLMFSGKQRGLLDLEPFGAHFIYEVFSPKKFKLKIGLKYLYPLRNKSGQVEYAVALSKTTIETSNYKNTDD